MYTSFVDFYVEISRGLHIEKNVIENEDEEAKSTGYLKIGEDLGDDLINVKKEKYKSQIVEKGSELTIDEQDSLAQDSDCESEHSEDYKDVKKEMYEKFVNKQFR